MSIISEAIDLVGRAKKLADDMSNLDLREQLCQLCAQAWYWLIGDVMALGGDSPEAPQELPLVGANIQEVGGAAHAESQQQSQVVVVFAILAQPCTSGVAIE